VRRKLITKKLDDRETAFDDAEYMNCYCTSNFI